MTPPEKEISALTNILGGGDISRVYVILQSYRITRFLADANWLCLWARVLGAGLGFLMPGKSDYQVNRNEET